MKSADPPCARPRSYRRGRGRLVAVGGAEDKEGDCRILKEFVRLAKGAKARVVVMTVATDHPEEAGREYRNVFRRLGVDDTEVVDVSSREDAGAPEALEKIGEATALYFTGGDQLHITALMGGAEMQKLIHERHAKGLVIGGTSAGATGGCSRPSRTTRKTSGWGLTRTPRSSLTGTNSRSSARAR